MGKIKVGIVGCGAIGTSIALFIDRNMKDKLKLVRVCDLDKEKLHNLLKKLKGKPKTGSLDKVIEDSQLIIESANIETAREVILRAIKKTKDILILSVGVFVRYPNLLKRMEKAKLRLYVPSGAICGIDGLSALKFSKIRKIVLTTSKPPGSLKRTEVSSNKLSGKEKVIFRGKIKEAVQLFPRNINVSATIFLASCAKNIEVIIKQDPKLKRNVHHLKVEADDAIFDIKVENTPSSLNPKTSKLTILSVQALLEKIVSRIKIGS